MKFPKNPQSYSMVAKGLQIAAISIGLLFFILKACGVRMPFEGSNTKQSQSEIELLRQENDCNKRLDWITKDKAANENTEQGSKEDATK